MQLIVFIIQIVLFCIPRSYGLVCQKSDHLIPLTIYGYSEKPISKVRAFIKDMYSFSEIIYYNSESKLYGQTEFSETICIHENDEMSYRFIVDVEEELQSDVELAVFSGYGIDLASMRIKVLIKLNQPQTIFRGPFTVPHLVCSRGRQYSIFKNNLKYANQEFFYVWGTNKETGLRKVLLSYPTNADYISNMVDLCIPSKMTNLQIMMKSSGGGSWTPGSYISIYDTVKQTLLLSTALTLREEMIVDFPVGYPYVQLDIHIDVPTPHDRTLVTLWSLYSNKSTIVSIIYTPFPYYQHVIRRFPVIATENDFYQVRFMNMYDYDDQSDISASFYMKGKFIGTYNVSTSSVASIFRTSQFCEASAYKIMSIPRTEVGGNWTFYCRDGSLGYSRSCLEEGIWSNVTGPGCYCDDYIDQYNIEWKRIKGSAMIQKSCGLRRKGNIVMMCTFNGTWLLNNATCEWYTCKQEKHGGMLWPSVKANITYHHYCSNGELMMSRYCNMIGEWSKITSYFCYCDAINEAGYQWNRTQSNQRVQYACGKGYYGSIYRMCSLTGEWSHIIYDCHPIYCPNLKEYGIIYPRTLGGHSTTVTCPLPYSGTLIRYCQYDGSWGYIEDYCIPPSCYDLIVNHDRHGCLHITSKDKAISNMINLTIVPRPRIIPSHFNALLPASVCDFEINHMYNIYIQYQHQTTTMNKTKVCALTNMYGKQQCDVMKTPLLKDRLINDQDMISLRIIVETPFCYNLQLTAVQLKIESQNTHRPILFNHSCKQHYCSSGSFIIITTPYSLNATDTYSVRTKGIVQKSPISVLSKWSQALVVLPYSEIISVTSSFSLQPKSTHSIRLTWSFQSKHTEVPCSNYILHTYISSPYDETFDTRYLNHLTSETICTSTTVCSRHTLIVPIANNGLRYVFILEPLPIYSKQLHYKNATLSYIVPEQPVIEAEIINFDTHANITFSHSNMNVIVNCSVVNTDDMIVSQFIQFIDYNTSKSQMIYDLRMNSVYTAYCWLRDGFVEPRLFSIKINTIKEVPNQPLLTITNSSLHYVQIEMQSNHYAQLKCNATTSNHVASEFIITSFRNDAQFLFSYTYWTPQQTVPILIPITLTSSLTPSTYVDVSCLYISSSSSSPLILSDSALLSHTPYFPHIISIQVSSSSSSSSSRSVNSHALLTITFEAPIEVNFSDLYFFYLDPIDGLGSYFSKCPNSDVIDFTVGLQSSVSMDISAENKYQTIRIQTTECFVNRTSIHIQLPQLDSLVHYGLGVSLLDIITDTVSHNPLNADDLINGTYLYDFYSNSASPRISATLLKPENPTKMSIYETILIQYDAIGFVNTDAFIKIRNHFGNVILETRIGDNCSSLSQDKETKKTFISITLKSCPCILLPLTNYDIIIPASLWKQEGQETPSQVIFNVFTYNDILVPLRIPDEHGDKAIQYKELKTIPFSIPIQIGEGDVEVTVMDMYRHNLIYMQTSIEAKKILLVLDNPFIVNVNLTVFPFHPFSFYSIKWKENAIMSLRNVSAVADTIFFTTEDKSCIMKTTMYSQSLFCKYYDNDNKKQCYCYGVF